jgi:hypothetical protein
MGRWDSEDVIGVLIAFCLVIMASAIPIAILVGGGC